MVMDIFPDGAPRLGPNGGITIMNLIDDIGGEVVPYLQNRGPIYGSRPRVRGVTFQKAAGGVVFGFEDSRQQWIFVGAI